MFYLVLVLVLYYSKLLQINENDKSCKHQTYKKHQTYNGIYMILALMGCQPLSNIMGLYTEACERVKCGRLLLFLPLVSKTMHI
jgi:hypothetical protein